MSDTGHAITDTNPGLSLGQAALIAGASLFVMMLCAPFAEFYALPRLIIAEDIEATLDNISEQRNLYVAALWAIFTNYVADIIVAWALYIFFAPVHRGLSLLAALFQLVYAGLGLAALMNLFAVLNILDASQLQSLTTGADQSALLLAAYRFEWGVSLVLFGIHLVLIGWLGIKAAYVPKFIGYLLTIAGAGYTFFVIGGYVLPDVNLSTLTLTFLLEPVFMVWLLWRGRHLR